MPIRRATSTKFTWIHSQLHKLQTDAQNVCNNPLYSKHTQFLQTPACGTVRCRSQCKRTGLNLQHASVLATYSKVMKTISNSTCKEFELNLTYKAPQDCKLRDARGAIVIRCLSVNSHVGLRLGLVSNRKKI